MSIILPNCKKIFLPDEGYAIFNIDFSGADAMIVAWESECEYLMKFFSTSKEKLYIHLAREYLQREVSSSEPFYGKMKQFIHLCLTGEHEVLTRNGWVALQDYTGDCEIMVWDKQNSQLHFEKPSKMTKSFVEADEPLISFKGSNFEQICTVDHKLPYKNLTSVYAEDGEHKSWYVQTAENLPTKVAHPLGGFYKFQEEKIIVESSREEIEVQACLDLYGQTVEKGVQRFYLKETCDSLPLINKLKTYSWLEYRGRLQKKASRGITYTHGFELSRIHSILPISFKWIWEQPLKVLQIYAETILTIQGEKIAPTKKNILPCIQLVFHLQNKSLTYNRHRRRRHFVITPHKHIANSLTIDKEKITHEGVEVFCPTTSTGFFLTRKNNIISITGNTNYGGAKEKAATSSGLSLKVADGLQKWYFKICPEVPAWQQKIATQVKKYGFIENIFGARFYLLDTTSKTLLNQAYSLIPQSTIAIAINKGFVNIFRNENPKNIQVLMQVYDALMGQFLLTDATAPERIKKHLEIPLPYKVPLIIPTDLSISEKNYGEC